MLKSKVILPTALTILFTAIAIVLYLNSPLSEYPVSNSPRRERHFLYRQKPNLAELTDFSTDIVQIHVLDSRVEYMNTTATREETIEFLLRMGHGPEIIERMANVSFTPTYEVLTIYTVEILEVFQGELEQGSILEILRAGGDYGGYYWVVRGQIYLDIEQKYFVFLRENAGNLPHVLSVHSQGVYYVPNNYDTLATSRATRNLLRSAGRDRISLSLQVLANIAEANSILD